MNALNAVMAVAYVCRDSLFNVEQSFKITNISRIILSQSIKSLNLHECAIL